MHQYLEIAQDLLSLFNGERVPVKQWREVADLGRSGETQRKKHRFVNNGIHASAGPLQGLKCFAQNRIFGVFGHAVAPQTGRERGRVSQVRPMPLLGGRNNRSLARTKFVPYYPESRWLGRRIPPLWRLLPNTVKS